MTNNSFNELIESQIPKSLDDIVRLNRDKLRLELATDKDLKELESPLVITNLKGVLTFGFIYKWVDPATGNSLFFMIGHINGEVRHTSNLISWDPDSQAILTSSGSHYVLEKFVDPTSYPELLLGICAWTHRIALGSFFGMPEWFF